MKIWTTALWGVASLALAFSFQSPSICPPVLSRNTCTQARSRHNLSMIFDFIKKRSQEGLAQVQNIASKTLEGKLTEALSDSANYVKERARIDSENLQKLFDGLAKSRARLLGGIFASFEEPNMAIEDRLERLEEALLQADIGSVATNVIIEDLRAYAKQEQLTVDDIAPVMRERLIEALTLPGVSHGLNFADSSETIPTVILVIGANGMGKTTTIGKVSARLKQEGNLTVLLAACDTYRAAAVEQLKEWSVRANVSIEMPLQEERNGSPLPVLSRALDRAKAEGFDTLIIDTSGRLSNNFELTQELMDMKEMIQSKYGNRAPHETLLVIDGALGRNALDQATTWKKYVGITGLAITKMDGTARGGFVVSVAREHGIPVKLMGVGEKISDLRDFEPAAFVDALLGNTAEKIAALQERAQKIINRGQVAITGGFKPSTPKKEEDPLSGLRKSLQENQPQQQSVSSGKVRPKKVSQSSGKKRK